MYSFYIVPLMVFEIEAIQQGILHHNYVQCVGIFNLSSYIVFYNSVLYISILIELLDFNSLAKSILASRGQHS